MGTVKGASAVQNVSSPGIKLYPNPVKDQLSAPQCVDKMEVLSLEGNLLISSVGNSVSLSTLSKGIYMVRSFTNGSCSINKIIKD